MNLEFQTALQRPVAVTTHWIWFETENGLCNIFKVQTAKPEEINGDIKLVMLKMLK